MASGNWAQLIFGNDGKPCDLEPRSRRGASVCIIKNSVYVKHPKMWRAGSWFAEPIITKIEDGRVSAAGFDIAVARYDERDGVFFYASCYADESLCVAGIGCNGFISDLEWLKETHPDIYATIPANCLNECYSCTTRDNSGWSYKFFDESGRDAFCLPMSVDYPSMSDKWSGVRLSTARDFMTWLKTVASEEYCGLIDIESAVVSSGRDIGA